MKKNDLTGWRDVLSFTFVQTFKSKAFIISYLIMLILAVVSIPIFTVMTSDVKTGTDSATPITKIYVENKTAFKNIDLSGVKDDSNLSAITFQNMTEDFDKVADRIQASEPTSVILSISEKNGTYALDFTKSSKGPVKDTSMMQLCDAVSKQFNTFKLTELGASPEQAALIQSEVTTKVSMADVNGETIVKQDTSISNTEYWFIYGILFIILMVNIMASTQIASSIVTEKSTRVIEYLLTSVRPLALMVGKTIAMLSAVIIQMGSIVLAVIVSNKLSSAFLSGNGKDVLSSKIPSNIFDNLNFFNIIICFVLIILGMVFYATLASLAGATVSKIEELKEGLQIFTIINAAGAYIGLAAANILMGMGNNSFVTFAYLFPLSSPFILPGALLAGKASALLIVAAILLQIVTIVLLFRFVAKVFETLILHNGNTIKLKELFAISKTV
jgi:ABC-type Na+ efflux pump, permease component